MNANFALTDIPGRRRPQLSQELRLHLQLAVLPLKFAEPGSVGDRQWWLLADVVQSVLVHPAPEGAFVHLNFPGDLGYRPGRLDHHFHGLVLELRCELPAPFSHKSSSVPGRTLLGPVSGIWEARQTGYAAMPPYPFSRSVFCTIHSRHQVSSNSTKSAVGLGIV